MQKLVEQLLSSTVHHEIYGFTIHKGVSQEVCPRCKKNHTISDIIVESFMDSHTEEDDGVTVTSVRCILHGMIYSKEQGENGKIQSYLSRT